MRRILEWTSRPWVWLAELLAGNDAAENRGLWVVSESSALGRILAAVRMAAITVGDRIFVRAMCWGPMGPAAKEDLLRHERAHVAQWARWGVLFPFAYLVASVVSRVRGTGWYTGNTFEVEAREGAE